MTATCEERASETARPLSSSTDDFDACALENLAKLILVGHQEFPKLRGTEIRVLELRRLEIFLIGGGRSSALEQVGVVGYCRRRHIRRSYNAARLRNIGDGETGLPNRRDVGKALNLLVSDLGNS